MEEDIISFRSAIQHLETVHSFITGVCQKWELPAVLHQRIQLCVTEAVNNAILHGNAEAVEKQVTVQAFRQEQDSVVWFIITDEGHGFNPVQIPDPTRDERLYQENGRGLYLMQQLSDKVVFLNQGSRVELHFNY